MLKIHENWYPYPYNKIFRRIRIFSQIFIWSRDLSGNLKFVKNDFLKIVIFNFSAFQMKLPKKMISYAGTHRA